MDKRKRIQNVLRARKRRLIEKNANNFEESSEESDDAFNISDNPTNDTVPSTSTGKFKNVNFFD